jgi:uncharacterized Zn finger protein
MRNILMGIITALLLCSCGTLDTAKIKQVYDATCKAIVATYDEATKAGVEIPDEFMALVKQCQ